MPKPRNKQTRVIKNRILLLCEGGKTEPCYFKGIRESDNFKYENSTMELIIHDIKKNTAKELVHEAIRLIKEAKKEHDPFNSAWVVFDKDGYTKHPEAFDTAYSNKVRIAFSSISFEYWILLHLKYTARPFLNSDDVIKEINRECSKLGLPQYDKAANNYEIFKNLSCTAITNARKLRKICIDLTIGAKIYDINPYTDVDKLFCNLFKIEQKEAT